MDVNRFLRVALTELNSTPALAKCESKSFLAALMLAAQLGVEPGKGLGHSYLIPYGTTVTFILGYRGMIDLARRSGQIVSINAHEVYENDLFELEYGIEEKLVHRPSLGERGAILGVYSVAKLVGGGYQMDWMSRNDVEKIRERSKAGRSGPWVSDWAEMAKKTVVRRMFKYLPISIEVQKAVAMDEAADRGEQSFEDDNIFSPVMDALEYNSETGEVTDSSPAEEALKSASDRLADKIGG